MLNIPGFTFPVRQFLLEDLIELLQSVSVFLHLVSFKLIYLVDHCHFHVKGGDHFDAYQFGFTSGCSTSLCTGALKCTVDCYTQGGSHVFASFLDFSKAFDKVCYWKLFHKLLDDNIDVGIVPLLAFWYSNQQACIRWHEKVWAFFTLGNGTRQGGVLSPWFCAQYVRDMWCNFHVGMLNKLRSCYNRCIKIFFGFCR